MSSFETLLLIAVITLIDLWIIYEIIKSATQSNKVVKLLQKQNDILIRLLEHQGGTMEGNSPLLKSNKPVIENKTDLNDPEILQKLLDTLGKK